MKRLLSVAFVTASVFTATLANAQTDKAKRPSPPASVSQKMGSTTITINYSQPSVKGRTIGKDLEPKAGQVWRTGANEATVFETDNDVMVEGKKLAKGKYALFSIVNGDTWTIIFNNTWKQWGAYEYKDKDDALRVDVKAAKAASFAETMTFTIGADGTVTLLWGDNKVSFTIK
jgi:hypothetical protein